MDGWLFVVVGLLFGWVLSFCRKEADDDRPDADTVFIAKRADDSPIDETFLLEFFSQFGDVKRIGGLRQSVTAKFVQFFDVRAVPKAVAASDCPYPPGGRLVIEEAVRRTMRIALSFNLYLSLFFFFFSFCCCFCYAEKQFRLKRPQTCETCPGTRERERSRP